MNKIERISSILVKLQSRRHVTAQHIAEQFGISQRTVYRDIRLLEEAGIPIVATAGEGYSIMEGYKLPPLMFTTEEALAFLMAEKVFEQQIDDDTLRLYQSGMNKIRAVIRSSDKEVLSHFDNHIDTIPLFNSTEVARAPIVQPLIQSIIQKKRIRITYTANYNRQTASREIEPVGIFFMTANWYLLAWCALREDYRTFHIGRIDDLTPTNAPFKLKHAQMMTLLHNLHIGTELHTVRIRVELAAQRSLGSRRYAYGLTAETVDGDYLIQEYNTHSLEHFAGWYLSFAEQADILYPEKLKEIVKLKAATIYERLDKGIDRL